MPDRVRSGCVTTLVALSAALCAGCGDKVAAPEQSARPAPVTEVAPSASAAAPGTVIRDAELNVLTIGRGCGGVPAELRGTWRYELRSEDLPPEFSDARLGFFDMVLGRGNLGWHQRSDEPRRPWAVCVAGDELHRAAHEECPGAGNEVLRWRVVGDGLVLTPIRSECFLTSIHFGDPWRPRRLRRLGRPAEPHATPTALPPELLGRWSSEIRSEELPPEVADMQTGRHVLELGPRDRARVVTASGTVITQGPVRVRGDRIRFAGEQEKDGACHGRGPGVYRFSVTGDDLRLALVRDACVYSAYGMTRPWRRLAGPAP